MGQGQVSQDQDKGKLTKEVLCDQLYNIDTLSDSDPDADELATLLRERRRKLEHTNPSPRSLTRTQRTKSAPLQIPGLGATKGDPSGTRLVSEGRDMGMDNNPLSPKGRPKEKNPAHRKEKQTRKNPMRVSERNQIFKGLVFFFIPNDNVSPARRMRIQRSIEFGAGRAMECSSNVSHVIVDRNLTFEDVKKCLKMDSFPCHLALVNETYPAECISHRAVLDPSLRRFQVNSTGRPLEKGPDVPQAREQAQESLKPDPPPRCWKPKDITPEHSQRVPLVPSDQDTTSEIAARKEDYNGSGPSGYADALDQAIETIKSTTDLPLDISDEDKEGGTDSEGEEPNLPGPKRRKTVPDVPSWQNSFACMHKHNNEENKENPNQKTIDILQKMLDYYDRTGDQWRCLAYRKAISALRNEKEKITSRQQALSIRGIGDRLALKIEEIVWTDRLRRLEYANLESSDVLLSQFLNIYGVGFSQASKWIAQGYKSLDSLREKGNLTHNQRIGLDHYDDFLQRIPRNEVEAHGESVRASVLKVDDKFQVIVGGSYRRGSPNSGDIDVIITKDGASLDQINQLMTRTVIPELYEQGFLKTSLAVSSRADSSKWHGASALPGNPVWRRIDLLFVPGDELGAALIYFTGNDVFNRSLRLLASKKGMCLNQKGLFGDIMRQPNRVKLNGGRLLEGRDEKRIFELLGVPWRPPQHRVC